MGTRTLQTARDAVLCIVGLALTAHEALQTGQPRIPLLVLYSAMMGLPATIWAVAALRGKE